jgi:septum formation protein
MEKLAVILASGSPRRVEILRGHGIEPTVILPQVDEELVDADGDGALLPEELVAELALRKATDVYRRLVSGELACLAATPQAESPKPAFPSLILAADTVVYKDGVGILGKPGGHDEAVAMLEALRNTEHQVYTGVALIHTSTGETDSFVDVSTVRFGDYTLEDIEDFLITEPPYDKAGAYAAQGLWASHIERIDGDRENVIGLPYYRIEPLLHL